MERYGLKLNLLKTKRLFWIITCSPRILYRSILFVLKRRYLKLNSFNCSANYCIDGTLNQLRWDVENALFITLDNSSRIFFESGDIVFKVAKEKSCVELKCFGLDKTRNAFSHLKIIDLKSHDFSEVSPKEQGIELNGRPFQMSAKKVHLAANALQIKPAFPDIKIPNPKAAMIINGEVLDRLSKIQMAKTLLDLGEAKSEITN